MPQQEQQQEAQDEAVVADDFSQIVDEFGCQAFEMHTITSDDEEKEQWVRLQAKPDIADMTKEEILERIRQVEEEQSAYGPSDLYRRDWVPTKIVNGDGGDTSGADSANTFSVLQFNILAQGLSFGPNTQSPFSPTQKLQEYKAKNSYGGFSSVAHPEVCLDFELRQWRLLQAILDADTDIVALEEIDRYHGFFLPMLQKFGYEGLFLPKVHSPGVKLGWYSDGCAILYKTSAFSLKGQQRHAYRDGNQVCLVARLQHLHTNQVVTVAATHLKAQQKEACEAMRKQQVDQLLNELLPSATADTDGPILVLGDFNTEPSSSSVKQMQDSSFASVYDLKDDPNLVTTWKTRGNDTVRRTIDYIFYTNSNDGDKSSSTNKVKCTATLSIPFEEMKKEQLPSLRYPSDHILIGAKFELVPSPPSRSEL